VALQWSGFLRRSGIASHTVLNFCPRAASFDPGHTVWAFGAFPARRSLTHRVTSKTANFAYDQPIDPKSFDVDDTSGR
jgi:hypothetical protein